MQQILPAIALLTVSQLPAPLTGAGGWIEASGPSFRPASFHLMGRDFSVSGGFVGGWRPSAYCELCKPPTDVPMTTEGYGSDLFFENGVFHGQHFGRFSATNDALEPFYSFLRAEAADIEITGPGTYTGDAFLILSVCGITRGNPLQGGQCQLIFHVAGAGEYETLVVPIDPEAIGEEGHVSVTRTIYSFQDELQLYGFTAVPEPATVTMYLLSAVLLVLLRLHRTRRAHLCSRQ